MLTITDRIIDILRGLRRYKFLTTAQLRRWYVPSDKDGAVTRDVLRKLRAAGLAHRLKAEVHDPLVTSSVPVWIPTEAGCCVAASRTGDTSLLLDCAPNTNAWTQFAHYCCVSEVMHTIELAVAAQSHVRLGAVYFEHDMINASESDPKKRFKTYTVVQERDGKKIVCVPDASFEIIAPARRRAYYVELDRGTEGSPQRVAAKKIPGYAGLAQSGKFRLHFPQAQDMRVLAVCTPGHGWRDALRKAVAGKPGSDMWLFASMQDITPASFLAAPIIYRTDDGPRPFVRTAPATAPAAETGAQRSAPGAAVT